MKIILLLLSFFAKACVLKHKPFVVWITWSVGKTSATNFIFQLLKQKYWKDVFMSPYNYNGEFWVPLTILNQKTWWKNPILWLLIFVKSIFVIFSKKYPKILVLEYWIDHIWEMDYMTNIVSPDISVVLNISENHIEQLKTIENIKNEKLKIITEKSKAIFNKDDENLSHLSWLSYWINSNSKLKAKNINLEVWKISFDLIFDNKEYKNLKYNLIWEYQVYNVLAMIWVWIQIWMSLEEIISYSKGIFAPEWRWAVLAWINNSIIIDWSYNWGYKSISEWIKYLQEIEKKYIKIALLWDMRELWDKTQEFHEKISLELTKSNIDYIILVWSEFKKYWFDLLKNYFWENKVFTYLDSRKAWEKVKEIIKLQEKQSIIFVKWSQNTIFLEEGIKEFCLENELEKLVRQWKKREKVKNKFYEKFL